MSPKLCEIIRQCGIVQNGQEINLNDVCVVRVRGIV